MTDIETRLDRIEREIALAESKAAEFPESSREVLNSLKAIYDSLKSECFNFGQTTCGEFKTEKEAEDFFDKRINADFFVIEKQVVGRRVFDDKPQDKSIRENGQNLRPDRILYPTERAFNDGWIYGPIGVEIKKSNITVGPVFTQILEQRQALYYSRHLCGARIMPSLFAIFPARDIKFDIHSLSERQSIVSCRYCNFNKEMKFQTAGHSILSIGDDGIWVNPKWRPSTRKGHQGRQK
jgi:hypothetical protein